MLTPKVIDQALSYCGIFASATFLAQTEIPQGAWDYVSFGSVTAVLLWMVHRVMERAHEAAKATLQSHNEEREEWKRQQAVREDEWRLERERIFTRMDAVEGEAKEARQLAIAMLKESQTKMESFTERQLLCQSSIEKTQLHIADMAKALIDGNTAVKSVLQQIIAERPCLFERHEELIDLLRTKNEAEQDAKNEI